MDFSMPKMNGPQTTIEILRMCKDANIARPTIYCVTAYQEDAYKEIALASGIKDFFSKPISKELVD